MRIYVCVKHVPDTAANIKITNDTGYRPEKFYWAVVTFTASPSNSLNEKGSTAKIIITEEITYVSGRCCSHTDALFR